MLNIISLPLNFENFLWLRILAKNGKIGLVYFREGVKYVGILENILGIKQPADYTVKNNRTGEETSVRDAKELERFAEEEQHENYAAKPDPFISRIFSR